MLVLTLMVGLIAGVVAKFLMAGRHPVSLALALVLGLAGAIFGWAGKEVGLYPNVGDGLALLASALGAGLLLGTYRALGSLGSHPVH